MFVDTSHIMQGKLDHLVCVDIIKRSLGIYLVVLNEEPNEREETQGDIRWRHKRNVKFLLKRQ